MKILLRRDDNIIRGAVRAVLVGGAGDGVILESGGIQNPHREKHFGMTGNLIPRVSRV